MVAGDYLCTSRTGLVFMEMEDHHSADVILGRDSALSDGSECGNCLPERLYANLDLSPTRAASSRAMAKSKKCVCM